MQLWPGLLTALLSWDSIFPLSCLGYADFGSIFPNEAVICGGNLLSGPVNSMEHPPMYDQTRLSYPKASQLVLGFMTCQGRPEDPFDRMIAVRLWGLLPVQNHLWRWPFAGHTFPNDAPNVGEAGHTQPTSLRRDSSQASQIEAIVTPGENDTKPVLILAYAGSSSLWAWSGGPEVWGEEEPVGLKTFRPALSRLIL